MTSATQSTFAPPIPVAQRWAMGVSFPPDRPLINVSQAAPVDPPPAPLRAEMARLVQDDPGAHLYGPVLGLPELRAELAAQWSASYGGSVRADQVAITAGCNQAFTTMLATLCGPGDAVMLALPFYFNHAMALDMAGVTRQDLPTGPDLLPDPEEAAARITSRTRAIVLISPNNPAGVEYPPGLIQAFYDLCKSRGIALVIDETYRDFHQVEGAPHGLIADPDWDETLITLYSFSKAYRLTGHRVGAVLAGPARLREAEKYLDTVAICAPQLGQRAALWGLRNLSVWLAGERAEVLARRAAITEGFAPLTAKGWALRGLGAYFAYISHPFDEPTEQFAERLVHDGGVLCLPGTMFHPKGQTSRDLRIAFANIDRAGIGDMIGRLADLPS